MRDGDRFWYESEKHFTQEQIRAIKKVTMARIFCDSGDKIEVCKFEMKTIDYTPPIFLVLFNIHAPCSFGNCVEKLNASLSCEPRFIFQKVPEDVFLYNGDARKYIHCKDLPKFSTDPFMECGGKVFHR